MSTKHARERRRGERRRLDDDRFWRVLRGDRRKGERRREPSRSASRGGSEPAARPPAPEPYVEEALSSEALEARRTALRGLLQAAEARAERAGHTRAPVLASGVRVRVSHGRLAGRVGLVLDADYIESRVLLEIEPDESPCWVPFSRVVSAERDEPAGGRRTSED